jgi:hypothetical protein
MARVVSYANVRIYFFHPLCYGKKNNIIAELLLLNIARVV